MEDFEQIAGKVVGVIIIGLVFAFLKNVKQGGSEATESNNYKLQFKIAFEVFKTKITMNAPFNPAIAEVQLKQLKSTLKIGIPEVYILLLKEGNGQRHSSIPLFGDYLFLSSDQVIEHWLSQYKLMNDGAFKGKESNCDASIIKGWWNSYWIPFARNKQGDFLCIDMGPTTEGAEGQVISVLQNSAERSLCAQSFIQWFEELGNNIEN